MAPSDLPSEDEQVEIVYGYARTDPDDPSSLEPRTKMVPRDWYETAKHADEVLEDVKDEWIRRPGVRSVGLSIGGGHDETAIVVSIATTDAEARDRFPESVEGVPIRTELVDASEGYPL